MASISRYRNPFASIEPSREPPPGSCVESLALVTADRAISHGFLWLPAGPQPKTVVTLMHPRANFTRHYAVPGLLEAGYAVLTQNSRWVGNDSTLIHERVLFDVAAGMVRLRERGFEQVVPIGNSGGGSLYTFYIAQAHAGAEQRLAETAAGDRIDLSTADMPPVDAMVYLAAHPGEGAFLMKAIDASVSDETDPLSCDSSLDMYDPTNGFRRPPESSSYNASFLQNYRQAQRARVERIDTQARELVKQRRTAGTAVADGKTDSATIRKAIAVPYLTVYRTEADPRYVDLTLDASVRDYGSLFSVRPDLFNYGPVGFARTVTPEAWLSTWSGLSSRAELASNAAAVDVPTLVVSYSGDNCVFPADAQSLVDQLTGTTSDVCDVGGDHYGFADRSATDPAATNAGREAAVDNIVAWLRQRGL